MDRDMFSGFKVPNAILQDEIDAFGYDDNTINDLLSKYEDIIFTVVTGLGSPVDTATTYARLNEFADHMSNAASKGNPVGVAFSCFFEPGGFFAGRLPVPISEMDEAAFGYLQEILKIWNEAGLSKTAKQYLINNLDYIIEKSNSGDSRMQEFWDNISGHIGYET